MTVRNRMEPTSHSKSNINNYSSSSSSVDDGSIAYIEPGSAALALATMHIAGSRKMGSHSSNFNNDENGGVASTSTTAAPASSTMTTTIVNLSEHISASGSAAEDAAGDVDDCGGVKRKRGGRNRQFSDEQRKVRNRIAQAAHRKKKNNYMAELVNLCTNRKEAGVALRDRLQICSSALFHTRSALSRALHLLELIKTNEASRKRTSVGTNSSDERLSSISSDFDEVDWINAMVGERQTIASYINLSETISTGDLDKEKAEDEKLMRFASSILEEEPKPLSLISNNNEDEEQSKNTFHNSFIHSLNLYIPPLGTSFTTFSNYVSSTSRYSSKSTTLNARVENDGRAIVTRSSTRKSNYSLRSRSESINSSSSSLPDGAVGRYGPSKYDRTVEEEVVEAAVVHKVPQIVEAAATTIKDKPSRVSRSLSQDSSSLSGANATGLAYCSSSPLSQKSSSILSPPSPPQLTLTTTTTATTSSTTASQKHIVETLSTQAVMEMDFPEKLSETGQQHSDVTTKINSVDKTRSAAEAVAATLVVGGVNTVPLTENLPASKPTANRSSSLSSVKTTTTTNSTPTTSYGSISTTNSSLYSAFPAFSSSHSSPSLTELEAASSLLSYSQPPPTSSTIISALTSNPTDEKNATDHFLAQISNIRRSFLEGELVDQQYPHHHHNSFLPHHHSRNQHLHQQFSIEPVLDRNGSNVALASSSSVAMAAPYQNSFHPPHHHHQPSHYTQTRFISTTPCPHQHNNNRNHHAQLLNHQQLEHRGGGEEAGSNHMFVDDVRNFIPSPHNYLDYMPPPPPQPHSTQFDFRQPPSNSSSSSSDGAVVAAAVAALAHHQQQQDYNHHQIMMVGGIPLPQPAPYPAHLDFEYQQRRGGDVGGMNQYAPCGGGGALPVTSAQQNFW